MFRRREIVDFGIPNDWWSHNSNRFSPRKFYSYIEIDTYTRARGDRVAIVPRRSLLETFNGSIYCSI